jgi:hypothetical protein
MTWRPIMVLAMSATACLAAAARLLDTATVVSTAMAIAVLGIGMLLAATAVVGAWRAPEGAQQSGESVSLPGPDRRPVPRNPRATR